MYRINLNIIRYLLALIVCAGFCGCMVGPDYSRPETVAETETDYFYLGRHSEDVNDVRYYEWWKRFDDHTINEFVTEMMINNYDLKAAGARLLQAKAAFTEVTGRQLPQVSYNFSRSRGKTSFNFGGAGRFSNLSTAFTQDISIGYALDIFGKLKRAERAAWSDILSSQWKYPV